MTSNLSLNFFYQKFIFCARLRTESQGSFP